MSGNQHSGGGQRPYDAQVRGALAIERLLGPLPISWDEVESSLPMVNRRSAERYLREGSNDPNEEAIYETLFACHPGLRAAIDVEVDQSERTIVVMELERGEIDSETSAFPVRLSSSEGYVLEADPTKDEGYTSLRFLGRVPGGVVEVFVDGVPIELTQPFDADDIAWVRTQDLASVYSGDSVMEISIMPYSEVEAIPGITDLAFKEEWPQFEARLRPLLLPLMRKAGIDESLGEELLAFLRLRAGELRGRRFRECLPDWLGEFADAHKISEIQPVSVSDWEEILIGPVVDAAIKRVVTAKPEPDWMHVFRERISGLSLRDLSSVESSAGYRVIPRRFQRILVASLRRECQKAIDIWQLN